MNDVLSVQTFDSIVEIANRKFESGDFAKARALYQDAVNLDPRHANAFFAVVRIELCEDQLIARDWYGERLPDPHAVGILSAIPIGDNRTPYVHHVLCGKAAYEAFHVAHYLTDLLRVRRHPNIIHTSFLALYLTMRASGAASDLH